MDDFIEVYDGALSPEFCQQMIAVFEQSPHLIQGKAGGLVDTSKKISQDLLLNSHPEYAQLLQHISSVTAEYLTAYMEKYRFALIAPLALTLPHPLTGQATPLTIENYDELASGKTADLMKYLYRLGNVQAQKYPQGLGNYRYWHCEVFPMAPHNEQLHRSLLFMFYLNDVEQGGETEFYYQKKSITPRMGRMVIAPAYFTHTHRGCVPVSGDKYILTSWVLLQRAENLYA
ncbi:2OG-Fe(II) oxygenase [Undibacterium baiyunense]|uniref:2OG-Fe(II) oxygenase n=1 Tax=Undibacterium baiyunense TaxID=2828731 RepID=A0A941I227_9BURK|nr:2OG-Fe(II) oxygenase [Undibacterium baiyunense]MBR7745867.1 2OG-Fe(II) oxygenase [Undibacterium baiyunense]